MGDVRKTEPQAELALSERQRLVLQAVATAYLADATPVGSSTLSHSFSVRLSPASIRNTMAELCELGFLETPHTSAGRVPFSPFYELSVIGDAGEVDVVLVDLTGNPIPEGSGVVVRIYMSVSTQAAVQDVALAISGAEAADEIGNPVDIVVQDVVLRIR